MSDATTVLVSGSSEKLTNGGKRILAFGNFFRSVFSSGVLVALASLKFLICGIDHSWAKMSDICL